MKLRKNHKEGHMTDTEIIKIIRQDAEEGYRCLVKEYGGYVYAIVSGIIKKSGSSEDIEECVSDVFIKLVMDRKYLDSSRDNLKYYIGAAARNNAVDYYRKLTGRKRWLTDDEITDFSDIFSNNLNPERIFSDREIRNKIWESVAALGEPDSEIITAQYLFGKSVAEIAESLSLNVMTVYKRSKRARKKLEKTLKSYFSNEHAEGERIYETSVY